jgi:hypothetical protein
LGQGDVPAARETADRGLRLDGTKWDGLYVGRRQGNDLVYAAKVGPRLRRESAKALRARLTPLIRRKFDRNVRGSCDLDQNSEVSYAAVPLQLSYGRGRPSGLEGEYLPDLAAHGTAADASMLKAPWSQEGKADPIRSLGLAYFISQRNDTPMRPLVRHTTLQEYVLVFGKTISVNWSGIALCDPMSSAAPASVRL